MGNVRLFDRAAENGADRGQPRIPAGGPRSFAVIRRGESTCGSALEQGERVVAEDVTASPIFVGEPILGAIPRGRRRGAQSTP